MNASPPKSQNKWIASQTKSKCLPRMIFMKFYVFVGVPDRTRSKAGGPRQGPDEGRAFDRAGGDLSEGKCLRQAWGKPCRRQGARQGPVGDASAPDRVLSGASLGASEGEILIGMPFGFPSGISPKYRLGCRWANSNAVLWF